MMKRLWRILHIELCWTTQQINLVLKQINLQGLWNTEKVVMKYIEFFSVFC